MASVFTYGLLGPGGDLTMTATVHKVTSTREPLYMWLARIWPSVGGTCVPACSASST
jgi:hypothetical protein